MLFDFRKRPKKLLLLGGASGASLTVMRTSTMSPSLVNATRLQP